jgi:hypothetical protein
MTGGYPHILNDSIRGAGNLLMSNSADSEVDRTAYFTNFTSDGFSFSGGNTWENDSAGSYVAWNWKAGGAAVTNTD